MYQRQKALGAPIRTKNGAIPDDVLRQSFSQYKKQETLSVKVSTGPAQRKKGAQKCPCKQTVLQGQSVFTQS